MKADEVIKEHHFLNTQGKRYTVKEAYNFEVGSHLLGRSSEGGFDSLNLGLSLYFKMMKNLIFLYLILGIISIHILNVIIITIFIFSIKFYFFIK